MNFTALALTAIFLPMLLSPIPWLFERRGKSEAAVGAVATILAGAELCVCACLWGCMGEVGAAPLLCGFGLSLQATGFQLVLSSLAGFLWFMTTAFCPYYFHGHGGTGRYQLFSLLTLGAIQGVFLSADFVTLLVFFEIMSITSWVMVIHEQTKKAIDAAASYLGFAIIGGLCTMMGLFMLDSLAGTLRFDELYRLMPEIPRSGRLYAAGVLILTGFAAKAGMWPLHTWLPAAHPAAPAPASALLSGIITKAGIFGVCAVSVLLFAYDFRWGMLLLAFGVITMLTGAVLAIFSIDLKRTLACSSMSQIGFILVGIAMQRLLGEENAVAVYGSVLHILNHSLLKLCLFLCAGVLVRCCHSRDLNELRGFGRGKTVFALAFTAGTLGLTCLPLFGGYISKTLLHESIVEYIGLLTATGQPVALMKAVEILFLASGGFTVAYMLKLYVALFIDKNPDQDKMDSMNGRYIGRLPALILLTAAATSPLLGSLPHLSADRLAALCSPFFMSEGMAHAVHYFAPENLKGAAISLLVGGVTYFAFIRTALMRGGRYVDIWPEGLDLERAVYRPLLLRYLPFLLVIPARLAGSLFDWLLSACGMLLKRNSGELGAKDIDESFAVYPTDPDAKRGLTATLSYGMLLAGAIIALSLAYVLIR